MNPLAVILNQETKNFQKVEKKLTTEYAALQRRNQLHGASSCFRSSPASNAQPFPHKYWANCYKDRKCTHLHQSPKTWIFWQKKAESEQKAKSIHPSCQFLYLSHIISLVSNRKVLTTTTSHRKRLGSINTEISLQEGFFSNQKNLFFQDY